MTNSTTSRNRASATLVGQGPQCTCHLSWSRRVQKVADDHFMLIGGLLVILLGLLVVSLTFIDLPPITTFSQEARVLVLLTGMMLALVGVITAVTCPGGRRPCPTHPGPRSLTADPIRPGQHAASSYEGEDQ